MSAGLAVMEPLDHQPEFGDGFVGPRPGCDCLKCPCHIPVPWEGSICPDCVQGNHMDWKTGEREYEHD